MPPERELEDLPDQPLHELMNIFADSDEGGSYPPMVGIDTVTKDPWVADGRYHFHETTNPFTGFSWNYGGHEMDRWWSYRDYYTAYMSTPNGYGYSYETYGIDYAGYTMQRHLWGEKTLSDDKESLHEEGTPPQDTFRQQLSNLALLADYEKNKLVSTSWDITRLQNTIDDLNNLREKLAPYIDGEGGGSLNKLWKEIDTPDGPMQGSAAAAYQYRLKDLAYRMTAVYDKIPDYTKQLGDLRESLKPGTSGLATAVSEALKGTGGTVQGVLDTWYFHTSAGTETFNPERDQFQVLINNGPPGGEPVMGIPGDQATQDNINNTLYQRFRDHYKGVYETVNDLRDNMALYYKSVNDVLPRIEVPTSLPTGTPTGPGPGPGPGGGGGGGPENPFDDWEIENPFDDWEIENPFNGWDEEDMPGPPPPPPPPPPQLPYNGPGTGGDGPGNNEILSPPPPPPNLGLNGPGQGGPEGLGGPPPFTP
ncbi:hypothetical protein Q8A49_25850, partial [Nocardiopsis umidischolae]|nr:hypothetical protein [Nocardiopsis umidischolae]